MIARALEAAGTTTTSLTSAWSITQSANAPRALFSDFPLGNTSGPPNAPDVQLAITRAALDLAYTSTEPGLIVPTEHQWGAPWKDEARALIDSRTPREAAPQYERMSDMAAAVDKHGEELACPVC